MVSFVVALRPSPRDHAPLVAYSDYSEFADMCERMHEAYRELIATAINSRRKNASNSEAFFLQRAAMFRGCAEFDDMSKDGMRILLRLTKGRGIVFCHILNQNIINAVTTSSRTYVNTIHRLCLINADITFRINLEDMIQGMRHAVMQWCGHCDTHTGMIGVNLFVANFVVWGVPEDPLRTYLPLARLPDYVTAFAMIGHENLHKHTCIVLPDDVLRVICSYLLSNPSVV